MTNEILNPTYPKKWVVIENSAYPSLCGRFFDSFEKAKEKVTEIYEEDESYYIAECTHMAGKARPLVTLTELV